MNKLFFGQNITTSNPPSITDTKIYIGSTSSDLFYSNDSGDNWSQLDTSDFSWSRIGFTYFSDDGNIIIVLGWNNGNGYISTDGGNSFNSFSGLNSNSTFASLSETGQYILIGCYSGSNSDHISNNYGTSFTTIPSPVTYHVSNCMSISGQYMVIGSSQTKNYISSDYGVTWNASTKTFPSSYCTVSCDDTGQYVTGYYPVNTYMWISTDYGDNYTQVGTTHGWMDISKDAGLIFALERYGTNLKTSINQGSTWRDLTVTTETCRAVMARSVNRIFYWYTDGYKLYEVDSGGTTSTLIKDFTSESSLISQVACGDNEVVVLLANKKMFSASYSSITNWTYIYTYPSTSTPYSLKVK